MTITDRIRRPGEAEPIAIATSIQVPEVRSVKIEGEWLIPTNQVFIASLGVVKATDKRGGSTLREHLVIIEAQ